MPKAISPEELLEHAGWVRNLARSLTGCEASADDLTQDVWLAALRSPPRHRRAAGGWLRSTVRQLGFNRRRAEARRRSREQVASRGEAAESTVSVAERMELQRTLAGAILELDDDQQTVVVLQFYEELSVSEIARQLGVARTTIQDRSRAALLALRETLERSYSDDQGRLHRTLLAVSFSPATVATWTTRTARVVSVPLALFMGATMLIKFLIAIGITTAVFVGVTAWPESEQTARESSGIVLEEAQTTPETDDAAATEVATRRLSGLVRHRDDGAPMVGAAVTAFHGDTSVVIGQATSDGAGLYALTVPRDFRTHIRLRVTREGFVAQSLSLPSVEFSENERLEPFDLSPGAVVEGQVVDTNARPVARARVNLHGRIARDGGLVVPPRLRSTMLDRVETDKHGRFRFHAPPEEVFLIATHDSFAAQSTMVFSGAHPIPIVIEMTKGQTLRGRVVNRAAEPVAAADVRSLIELSVTDAQGQEFSTNWFARTRSDEAGRFALYGATRATELLVSHRHYMSKRVPAWTDSAQERIVELDGSTSLRARLVDEKQRPVTKHAAVFLKTARVFSEFDEGGELRAEVGTEVATDVLLFVRGHAMERLPLTPFRVNDFGTLSLTGAAPLEVRVEDIHGRPVDGAQVSLTLATLSVPVDGETTNSAGLAVLGPLWEAGQLYVVAKGYATHEEEIDVPSSTPVHTVVLKRPAAITGRLVDTDGVAVAGAVVRVVKAGPTGRGVLAMLRAESTVSSSDGKFRFPRVRVGEPTVVRIEATEYLSASIEVDPIVGSESRDLGDIVLKPARSVRGRVVDVRGNPIQGAIVSANGDIGRGVSSRIATTGGDGRYSLQYSDLRDTTVTARAAGFAWSRAVPVSGGLGDLDLGDIVLQPGTRLVGRVLDSDHAPVAGAKISVSATAGSSLFEKLGQVATDAAGEYVIDGVPVDSTFRLDVVAPYQWPAPAWRATFDSPLGVPDPIVLAEPATLVVDLSNAPEGATTFNYRLRGRSSRSRHYGRFEVVGDRGEATGLAAGEFSLVVIASSEKSKVQTVTLKAGGSVEAQPSWGSVTGRVTAVVVRDDRGQPVPNAKVALRGPREKPERESGKTDENGSFASALLNETSCSIRVTATGFAPYSGSAPQSGQPYSVDLQPESKIECVVLDSLGMPAPGVVVRVAPLLRRVSHHRPPSILDRDSVTDMNGRVVLRGLTGGSHWVSFTRGPEVLGVAETHVEAGQESTIEFNIATEIVIRGRVTRGGNPVEEGQIVITSVDGQTSNSSAPTAGGEYTATVRRSGEYRFVYLEPGERFLSVLTRRSSEVHTIRESARVDIALQSGFTVSDRITDADGAPVANARGSLRPALAAEALARGAGASDHRFQTSLDGSFTAEDVTPGEYRWTLSELPPHLMVPATTLVVEGNVTTELVLSKSITVTLDVETDNGADPVLLMLMTLDSDGRERMVTQQGRLTNKYTWPADQRRGVIRCFGYAPQEFELDDLSLDQTLTFRLAKSGVVKVYTLTAPETRAPMVEFEIEPLDDVQLSKLFRSGKTGSIGFLRLELPPGRYRFTAGSASAVIEAVVDEEAVVELTVGE